MFSNQDTTILSIGLARPIADFNKGLDCKSKIEHHIELVPGKEKCCTYTYEHFAKEASRVHIPLMTGIVPTALMGREGGVWVLYESNLTVEYWKVWEV